jgi:hypothetical protein
VPQIAHMNPDDDEPDEPTPLESEAVAEAVAAVERLMRYTFGPDDVIEGTFHDIYTGGR